MWQWKCSESNDIELGELIGLIGLIRLTVLNVLIENCGLLDCTVPNVPNVRQLEF